MNLLKKWASMSTLLILAASVVFAGCGVNSEGNGNANKPNEGNISSSNPEDVKSEAKKEETDAYYLGVVAQLSGPAAAYGVPTIEGMEYEVERLNKINFTKKPIRLEILNDESKEAQTVTLTNRFIGDPKIVAVGGFTSSSLALAAKPVVNREGITQIVWSTSDKISNPLEKWTFQIIPTATSQAKVALQFFENKGIKKVALLHEQGDFGDSWEAGVVDNANDHGIEIVLNEQVVVGEKDFTVMISKVKNSGAEGLFIAGSTPMSAGVAKAAAQLQLGIPMINSSGGTTEEFIRLAGTDGEGIYGVSTGLAGMEDKLQDGALKQDLLARSEEYTKITGKKIEVMHSGGITLIDLFATAINIAEEQHGEVTRENFRDAFESIKDAQLWVGTFNYSATDHLGVTNANPIVVNKDGKWELHLTPDQLESGQS